MIGNPEIVNNEPARLILEHSVDSGYRLHQAMSPHRLIDVHCVQARTVESGKPHVTNNDDLQRVFGVFESGRQLLTPRLATSVRCHPRPFAGVAGHYDLDRPLVVVLVEPVRTKLDDLVVQIHTDSAAHADDECLAIHRSQPLLEMPHQVIRCKPQALLGPDKSLQSRPLRLQLFLLR